jgi:phosphoribosylformylglycinamidine synthase
MIVRPRVLVLKADGTNCEVETAHGFEMAGAAAEIVPINRLKAGDRRLEDYQILALPGGFSYGDDVTSGKILAVELLTFAGDDLARFAEAGKPIVGICNGFQVLVRTGLLPFQDLGELSVTLGQNAAGRFECRWVAMCPAGSTELVAGLPERIELPVAHGEGRFYADDATLARVEADGLVALRYVDDNNRPTDAYPDNPNGSLHAIAGITDRTGRIFGLMPHPERFVVPHQYPSADRRNGSGTPDGLALLRRIVAIA